MVEAGIPQENEIQGPLHYVEIEVPAEFLYSNATKQEFLEYLRQHLHPEVVKYLVTNQNGKSTSYAFRGVIRENKPDIKNNEWYNERYNVSRVDQPINTVGYERFIREGKDELLVTIYPHEAASFARPKKDFEVGFLLIYDNHDGLFNPPTEEEWISSIELNERSTLRDRLHSVVIIKPLIKQPLWRKALGKLGFK